MTWLLQTSDDDVPGDDELFDKEERERAERLEEYLDPIDLSPAQEEQLKSQPADDTQQ